MSKSREDKKVEAIERMRLLKIFPQTISQFEKSDLVSVSEPPFGAFFWVDDFQKELIEKLEKERNILVYMGILSYTNFGRMLSLLYVSDYEEEWEDDRSALKNMESVAYVYNYDTPDTSEAGWIGLKYTIGAGLLRSY